MKLAVLKVSHIVRHQMLDLTGHGQVHHDSSDLLRRPQELFEGAGT
jgi:hypothetical protein